MDSEIVRKVVRRKQVALRKRAGKIPVQDATPSSNTENMSKTDTSETYVEDTPPDHRLLRKRGRPRKNLIKDISQSTEMDIQTEDRGVAQKQKQNIQKGKGKLVDHLPKNKTWGNATKPRKRGLRLSKGTCTLQRRGASTSGAKGVLDEVIEAETAESSGDEMKPKNNFGFIDIEDGLTYYRCNLKTAVRDLRQLPFKNEHLSVIKQTPFWVLFNSIYTGNLKKMQRRCQKFEEDIRSVMKTYDTRSKKFIIARQFFEITKMDVQLILGVTGGSIKISLKKSKYTVPDWAKRCFQSVEVGTTVPRKKQMYKSLILRMLKQIVLINTTEGYKDTARLVHCYLLAMFLAPSRNCSINRHIPSYLVNLESIYTYDWCGFILDNLISHIERTRNFMSGGCTLLLVYWFCEHTGLIEPYEDMPMPRCMRWDLKELNGRLGADNISRMRKEYLRHERILPTNQEKEEYRELKAFWDKKLSLAKSSENWIPDEIFVSPDVNDSSASTEEDSQSYHGTKNRMLSRKKYASKTSTKQNSAKERGTNTRTSRNTTDHQKSPNFSTQNPRSRRTTRAQLASINDSDSSEFHQPLKSTRLMNSPLDTPGTTEETRSQLQHQSLESQSQHIEQDPTTSRVYEISPQVTAYTQSFTPNKTARSSFHTPDTGRLTRSRALQRYTGHQPQQQRFPHESKSPRRRTGRITVTSRNLQNELGLLGTGETVVSPSTCAENEQTTLFNEGSSPAREISNTEEKDAAPLKDCLHPTTKQTIDTSLGKTTAAGVPSQPSFSIGMTQYNNTQGITEEVYMEELLQDINQGTLLDIEREPGHISRDRTIANAEDIRDTSENEKFGNCSEGLKDKDCNDDACIENKKLRIELACKDSELKQLREKLQLSDKRIIAMEKMHEVNLQRKVASSVAETKSKHQELFETTVQFLDDTIKKLMEENDKLSKENQELKDRLKAELEPSGTQLLKKETTQQLFDAIVDKEHMKSKYGKLVGENRNLTNELQLVKERDQQTATTRPPEGSTTGKDTSAVVKNQNSAEEELLEPTSVSPTETVRNDSPVATVIGVLSAGEGGIPTLKSKDPSFVKGSLYVDLAKFDGPAGDNTTDIDEATMVQDDNNFVQKKKKRRAKTPNTMIRIVKSRTLNDDRKKMSSDQLEEPYYIDDVIDDSDKVTNGKTDNTCTRVLPLNRKKGVVRIMKDEVRVYLEDIWSKDMECATVWRGKAGSRLDVHIIDILMVLHDERISSDVVDCWGDLLLNKFSSGQDTIIFLTASWDYIYQYKEGSKPDSLVNVVDKRIEKDIGEDHLLLFPMLTKGKGRHEQGDHWTLLQLDLSECEWKFYNSLEPRSKKHQDVHFSRSLLLVDYIEQKIREVFRIKYPKHAIHKTTIKTPFPIYGPQQSHGSLDCGVVVCSNLENLITRTTITKYRLKHADAANYRAKIVQWFVEASTLG